MPMIVRRPIPLSLPRWIGGLLLGLSALSLGLAQERTRPERPERAAPSVERPPVERATPQPPAERPVAEPRTGHPRAQGPVESSSQANRPKPVRHPDDSGTSPTHRPPGMGDRGRAGQTTRIIIEPSPLPRCLELPTATYWRSRDLMAEIQAMARRGAIAVRPGNEDLAEFTGVACF